jgi:hypothetical protein
LPSLLRELKRRGYRIVHVVPATPDRPKTVTEPESWVMHKPIQQGWPRTVEASNADLPAPSVVSFGWPHPFRSQIIQRTTTASAKNISELLSDAEPLAWPPETIAITETPAKSSTIDAIPSSFGYADPFDGAVTVMAENPIVAPDEVLSAMIVYAPWSSRPKPVRVLLKRSKTTAKLRPAHASPKPGSTKPRALSQEPSPLARTKLAAR